MSTAGPKFQRLVEIMARLRAPGGCPWDREQTFDSIKPLHPRRDLRGPRRHRPRATGRTWPKNSATSCCRPSSTRRWPPKRTSSASTTRSTPSTRSWSAAIRTSSATRSAETADEVKRIWGEVKAAEKKDKGEDAETAARRRAARPAGAGGSAADRLARRGRRLRLGEPRAGASTSSTRNWREFDAGAPQRRARRARRRARRHAVRARQPGALRQGGSRAGAAQDQRQIPPALRATSSASSRSRARSLEDATHRRNGGAVAGSEAK